MAGIEERVKGFLDSWPIVKQQLEEVLKEDEELFHSEGVCRTSSCIDKNDLQKDKEQENPCIKEPGEWFLENL